MATSKKTDESAVSMADVSALNGGGAPSTAEPQTVADPDASRTYKATDGGDLPFISEGMRHDLHTLGHATDPVTGRKVELA